MQTLKRPQKGRKGIDQSDQRLKEKSPMISIDELEKTPIRGSDKTIKERQSTEKNAEEKAAAQELAKKQAEVMEKLAAER